jgi:hypothetical protein
MVPAELQHPRRRGGRRPEEREPVVVEAERRAAAPAARRRAAAAVAVDPQDFIAAHDLADLAEAVRAERLLQERRHAGALRIGEIAHAQTATLEHRAWEIRPAPALVVIVPAELQFRAPRVVE